MNFENLIALLHIFFQPFSVWRLLTNNSNFKNFSRSPFFEKQSNFALLFEGFMKLDDKQIRRSENNGI